MRPGGVGKKLVTVRIVASQAGADVHTVWFPLSDFMWVVHQSTLIESLYKSRTVAGIIGLSQENGWHFTGCKRHERLRIFLEYVC